MCCAVLILTRCGWNIWDLIYLARSDGFGRSVELKIQTPGKQTTRNLHGLFAKWAHLGSNQGPPDYESGALTS